MTHWPADYVMGRGYVVMYLISHPYGDSSAPYLGTAILMILCFLHLISIPFDNEHTT